VQDALLIVVVIVVPLAALIAIGLASTSSRAHDHIGRGGLTFDREPAPDAREAELRQLLEARNARRVARGEPPLDVDAEVDRRLSEPEG